jgi:universal stress protein E
MLAATDFSPVSRLAVEAAIQLTSATSGELHLLHVIDSSDVPDSVIGVSTVDNSLRQRINASAMQRFEEFMAGLPQLVRIRPHLSWGTPWREINRLVQEVHAELLVIGSIGRSGISGMLLGNTAERLLGSCSSSVLTLKPADFHCPIPVQEAEFSATASTTLIG